MSTEPKSLLLCNTITRGGRARDLHLSPRPTQRAKSKGLLFVVMRSVDGGDLKTLVVLATHLCCLHEDTSVMPPAQRLSDP
jgi:hypothetical protein